MKPTALYPEPNVIRFVRRFFAKPGRVLDIGSGSGNHAHFFEMEEWNVLALDPNPECRANDHRYIEDCNYVPELFDLILDHNTLCHIESPPYKKIYAWLNLNGAFLTVCPTEDAWRGVGYGKSYTRFASEHELRESLGLFRDVQIWPSSYPDFQGHEIKSHVAWGWK